MSSCIQKKEPLTTQVLAFSAALLLGLLGACSPVEAHFDLVFPSTETFFLAEKIEVGVFESKDADAFCTDFILGLPVDGKIFARIDPTPACAFARGEATLEALPPKEWVFTAVAVDVENEEILRGCKRVAVSEEYIDDDKLLVEISMSTTSAYLGAEILNPICRDEDQGWTQKCENALPCDDRTPE